MSSVAICSTVIATQICCVLTKKQVDIPAEERHQDVEDEGHTHLQPPERSQQIPSTHQVTSFFNVYQAFVHIGDVKHDVKKSPRHDMTQSFFYTPTIYIRSPPRTSSVIVFAVPSSWSSVSVVSPWRNVETFVSTPLSRIRRILFPFSISVVVVSRWRTSLA